MSEPNLPELHGEEHPGAGPFLLLVHGFLSNRFQFQPNLAALGEVTRPVVVELWGHGRSPAPEDSRLYHPDAYVEVFERLRNRLKAESWFVCGLSLGAALTLRYALACPERIQAQIFTNTSSAFADDAWMENVRQSSVAQGDAIETGGRKVIEQMPFHSKYATRMPGSVKAPLVKESERLDPAAVARTVRFTVPDSPVRSRIHSNRVPALLVAGTREKRFAVHHAFAEEHMPLLETESTDAGHAVNIENAAAFNESAVRFIRRQLGI